MHAYDCNSKNPISPPKIIEKIDVNPENDSSSSFFISRSIIIIFYFFSTENISIEPTWLIQMI